MTQGADLAMKRIGQAVEKAAGSGGGGDLPAFLRS